jgi:flagellar hook-associated protein 2
MVGITGIGSGIKIDEIVTALVNAERAPKTNQLDRLEKTTVARISAMGSLTSALNTFKTAVDSLNKASLFESRTASSSSASTLKVTAASTAPAGNYNVQVKQLATSSKVALQSVAGGNAATFNSGTLTISGGSSSFDVDITASNNTLAGMRDAINEAGKTSGVSATIISDDSGSRLVLSSTKSGAGNDIQIVANEDNLTAGDNSLTSQAFAPTVDPGNADAFVPPSSTTGAGGVITKAQSSKISIDGLDLVRDTNRITDALEGVTLDLVAAQSSTDLTDGKTISVTVGVDKSAVKTNLQKFVDAYNALISTTSQLTAVVPVDGGKPVTGPLLGDSSIRNVLSSLRNEMVSVTGEGGVRALADLGITSDWKTGQLKIDDTMLTKALDGNFDQVAGYLAGDNGLMGRLSKSVGAYVGSTGVLKQRTDALQTTKLSVDEQRTALNKRVESLQNRLYAQYNAMDSLVSRLQKTSESLANQLASLPGFVKKDN